MDELIIIAQAAKKIEDGTVGRIPDPLVELITVLKKAFLGWIPDKILPLFTAVLVLIMVWAGIQYITGGPQGGENAKKTITAAIIGAIIVALAWFIVSSVLSWMEVYIRFK